MNCGQENLREIYGRAIYGIYSDGREIRFKVGECNPEIEALLRAKKARSFALVTACNPGSKELSDSENQQRQYALWEELTRLGYRFLDGWGGSEDGSWKDEPGHFVFDISESGAAGLGKMFGQSAILYGEIDSEARLVWCQ